MHIEPSSLVTGGLDFGWVKTMDLEMFQSSKFEEVLKPLESVHGGLHCAWLSLF